MLALTTVGVRAGSEFEREGSEHGIDLRLNCLSLLRTIDTPSLTSVKLAGWPPACRRLAQGLGALSRDKGLALKFVTEIL